MSPHVKVCGITRLQDAELAVELGAWAVGMVFYEPSPRACSTEEALRIVSALRRRVELCGVFVNAPLDEVVQACDELGLTMVQLHGDEGPAYCAEVGHRTGAKVIKAVQVASHRRGARRGALPHRLPPARRALHGARQGGAARGHGRGVRLGAARRAALQGAADPQRRPRARERGAGDPRGLAQGHRARPFALDTASGTEAAPGRKDPERLRAFFAAAATDVAVTSPA